MIKTSAELKQKAAGYILAASNAAKREMSEKKKQPKNKQTVTKTTSIKKSVTKTTISTQK